MYAKILTFLIKVMLPILAVVAIITASVEYGKAQGALGRQPEITAANEAKVKAETNVSVLQGKVEAYERSSNQVAEVRAQLAADAEERSKNILERLGVLQSLVGKRTGDECKDVRQVAVTYFEKLKQQREAAK